MSIKRRQENRPLVSIDWNDVFKALDEVGYDGVYNMELKLNHYSKDLIVETAEFSIKVLRALLAQNN